jgi:hypothetical protein
MFYHIVYMNLFDFNDDRKSIISKHLLNNFEIRTMLSTHLDFQKILFGDSVFDDDFRKILKIQN